MAKEEKRLFFTLLLWMLLPTVYTTVRTALAGINHIDLNIFGAMEWFDLIDETITAFLTVPLYYCLKEKKDRKENGSFGFVMSFIIYCIFTVIVVLNMTRITSFMHSANAVTYLTVESFAMVLGMIVTLGILFLTLSGKPKIIGILTAAKIAGYIACDFWLIPKYKAVGSAYGDLLMNLIIAVAFCISAYKIGSFSMPEYHADFVESWAKRGLFSGASIFLDNIVYALAVVRIMNAVGNSGTYWAANNVIWGFLIPPVSCLAEIIRRRSPGKWTKSEWKWSLYILVFWAGCIVILSPFVKNIMMQDAKATNAIVSLLHILIPFYVSYIFSAFIDAHFIAAGKTWYPAVISVVVNIGYYGIAYAAFKAGMFIPSLVSISVMFGGGMIVHLVTSIALYIFDGRKLKAGTASGLAYMPEDKK